MQGHRCRSGGPLIIGGSGADGARVTKLYHMSEPLWLGARYGVAHIACAPTACRGPRYERGLRPTSAHLCIGISWHGRAASLRARGPDVGARPVYGRGAPVRGRGLFTGARPRC
jgi:hypothetical protein